MKRILFFVHILMIIFISSETIIAQNKGYKYIEEVKKGNDPYTIPYKKFVLNNGIKVVIHEDNSDPLVHLDVTYHVGSAREEVGKSGFAHFFEHMMFQGSENVGDEEHFKIITEIGGNLNGTTNKDRTNYFETVPVNQLETVLWLESDRMGYFLDAVTQKKFEVQRATVKNEKGQNYYNRPYGQFWLLQNRALYPYGHPYSWPTIGEIEDLNRVDVNDLKNFFLRWYGPNNVIITLGGQVKAEKVMPLIVKYFGDIKRGPEVEKLKADVPKLEKNRYVSYEDKNIELPAAALIWPSVPRYHPDEAALDILSEYFGTGKNSPMYKQLVKTNKAANNYVYNTCSEIAGTFTILSITYPKTPLNEIESIFNNVLDDFNKNGITDEELNKLKTNFKSRMINSLETVKGKVIRLSQYQLLLDNPNHNNKYIDERLNLTKEDIMAAFKKYIYKKPAVVISVIPKGGKIKTIKPDDYKIPTSGKSKYPKVDYSKVKYVKNKSSFDRSKRPTPSVNPMVQVPDYWEDSIHGIKVIGVESSELPIISFSLKINGGALIDKKNKYGTANILADMMMEGTNDMTAEQLSDEMLNLGARISFRAGQNSSTLYVITLKSNYKETIELIEKILFYPRFEQESLDKVKTQNIEVIKNNKKNVSSLARYGFIQANFEKNDRRYKADTGTIESIKSITMEDIKEYYNDNYSPNVSSIVVVGDIKHKDFINSIAFLKKWKDKKVVLPKLKTAIKHKKPVIYIVDRPQAAQSQFMFGYVTDLKFDPFGKYYRSRLMNFPFAGSFNSRLNLNLREDKGFTYGAYGRFRNNKNNVSWVFRSSIKADETVPALKEVIKELKKYRKKGITDEELEFTKSAISQSDALKYESYRAKAKFIRTILEYNLDKSYVKKQDDIIKSLTKKDVNKLIKEYINLNKIAFIIAGDKSKLKKEIEKEGLEVKILTVKF